MRKINFLALGVLCLFFCGVNHYSLDTRIRDDAGLRGDAGAESGFFQTSNPINYPAGAQGWWHMLDIRHSNAYNNYAMQFAGSFSDQDLYFRKTNDNPAQPWHKVLLEESSYTSIGNIAYNYIPNTGNWTTTGTTLRLNGQDYTTIGFHDSGNRVDFIKAGNGTIQLGYNGGWGEGHIGMPGGGVWNNQGNVGIGTTQTDAKLTVKGKVHAEEVKVDLSVPGPDYVFEREYPLLSLVRTDAYIKANKHLPEVPSAAQMKRDGIELGKMNMILLKKVEELT